MRLRRHVKLNGARLRLIGVAVALLSVGGCMTYQRALDIRLAEWRAMNPEAGPETGLEPENRSLSRQAIIHGAYVPDAGRSRVISFSAAEGERIRLKPLKLISTAESPLATLRYYELKNDPPVTDVYRTSGERHERFAAALSDAIAGVFGDSTRVNVDLVTVPSGKHLREIYESRVRNGEFGLRFYMPEVTESWLKQHRADLKTVSHEVFHAYDQISNGLEDETLSTQMKALDETAASIFAKCVELEADGRATTYGDPVPAKERKVGFTDAQLSKALNKDFEAAELNPVERRFISEVFAWSIWLDFAGPRWEMPARDPGANRLKSLCTNEILRDRRALLDVVRTIASDGEDGPVFDLDAP